MNTKILFVLSVSVLIMGCSTLPNSKRFNPEFDSDISHITVRKLENKEVLDFIVFHPKMYGAGLGPAAAIGAEIAASGRIADHKDEYNNVIKPYLIDFSAYFNNELKQFLVEEGYQVEFIEIPEENLKNGFIQDYPEVMGDAILDVGLSVLGYTSEYEKTYLTDVRIGAKLVSSKKGKVVYSQAYHYGYQPTSSRYRRANEIENEYYADRSYEFEGFERLKVEAETSIEKLKLGLSLIAEAIARDLKKK